MNSALHNLPSGRPNTKQRLNGLLGWSLKMFKPSDFKATAQVIGYRSTFVLRTGEWFRLLSELLRFTCPSALQAIRPAGYQHPLYVRVGTTDALVMEQVFVLREYSPFDDLVPRPQVMIDCGGNIGCASVYFLNRYPDLKVIVVEPDSDNVALCRRNLEPYGNRVQIVQAGAWSSTGGLVLSGTGWATKVRKAEPGESPMVEAIDIPSLLTLAPGERVDLLKIDIEWSEIDVFREGSISWLSQVSNIAIELHDGECEDVFFRALSAYHYEGSRFSEVTFCANIRPFFGHERPETANGRAVVPDQLRRFPRAASNR